MRLPPVGEPLVSLLAGWRERHPSVALTIAELTEPAMAKALELRRLDVGLITSFTPCSSAASIPLYVERLVAAVPHGHALAARKSVDWADLREEEFLIQEWGREPGDTRTLRVPAGPERPVLRARREQAERLRARRRGIRRHAGDREPGRG